MGAVVNVDGERGVISGSGEVQLRRRHPSNPRKVYAIRAKLTGSALAEAIFKSRVVDAAAL
jgi:hypothetical protein